MLGTTASTATNNNKTTMPMKYCLCRLIWMPQPPPSNNNNRMPTSAGILSEWHFSVLASQRCLSLSIFAFFCSCFLLIYLALFALLSAFSTFAFFIRPKPPAQTSQQWTKTWTHKYKSAKCERKGHLLMMIVHLSGFDFSIAFLSFCSFVFAFCFFRVSMVFHFWASFWRRRENQ